MIIIMIMITMMIIIMVIIFLFPRIMMYALSLRIIGDIQDGDIDVIIFIGIQRKHNSDDDNGTCYHHHIIITLWLSD